MKRPMLRTNGRAAAVLSCCLLTVLFLIGCGSEPVPAASVEPPPPFPWPDAARYQPLDGPARPEVGVAVVRGNGAARLYLALPAGTPDLRLGVDAGRPSTWTRADAVEHRHADGVEQLAFALGPAGSAGDDFRLAVALAWPDGPDGHDRRRERYNFTDHRATHAPFNPDPPSWAPFDLAAHDRRWAELEQRLVVRVRQPLDGKLTVVIDELEGRRVRNLVSGIDAATGWHEFVWDGLDEQGNLVAPGDYRWRSIHHPGIRPDYQMAFANGGETFLTPWGTNHGTWEDVTHNNDYVFAAAPLTEGGWALVALMDDGRFVRGYRQPHGTPYGGVAVAATESLLYAVHDGRRSRGRVDRHDPTWVADNHLTLSRYDIASGKNVDWPEKRAFISFAEYRHGPGADNPRTRQTVSLAGAARLGNRLYVSIRHLPGIIVLDLETGEIVDQWALDDPGPVAPAGDELLAVVGANLLQLNAAGKETGRLPLPRGAQVAALTVAEDGRIYVADLADHTIRALAPNGRVERTYGHPGGPYAGPYDAARLVNPAGLTAARGRLWVAEAQHQPKRVVAFHLTSGKVVVDKVGSPPYGSPGTGFDPENPRRWVALGCLWDVDIDNRESRITHVLTKNDGHLEGRCRFLQNYVFVRAAGREYLVGHGKFTLVSELRSDGSLVDRAFVGNPHMLAYGCGWDPPEAVVETIQAEYPYLNHGNHFRDHRKGPRGLAIFWVDRNGNGEVDREEVDMADAGGGFHLCYWGLMQHDLDLHISARDADDTTRIVRFTPAGIDANGVPLYPGLERALADATPLEPPVNVDGETVVDRFGRVIFNGSPDLLGVAADGRVRWRYPNGWRNVHGSHKAPLPEVGVIQGALQMLGIAPLDDRADVFMLSGNHGRFFILTSDGLYLDEMFRDVRMGGPNDTFHVGGEPFGGVFGRAETSGDYYLQTGCNGFRIYGLTGLDAVQRQEGKLTATPAQLLAAETRLRRRQAADREPRTTVVPKLSEPPRIDGHSNDWTVPPAVSWKRDGRFPVSVRLGWDAEKLFLLYDVRDPSPWRNSGTDWTTLFKTGDSVDLQLGTDATARPDRREPVTGDIRLLLAPFEGGNIGVLYHHRAPEATEPVVFSSPWRSETINVVRRLEAVEIGVQQGDGWYRIEAAVPLTDLGIEPGNGPFRADFGVLYGDPSGERTGLRSYWANPATALVSDVPGEIMLHPNLWGDLRFTNGNAVKEAE